MTRNRPIRIDVVLQGIFIDKVPILRELFLRASAISVILLTVLRGWDPWLTGKNHLFFARQRKFQSRFLQTCERLSTRCFSYDLRPCVIMHIRRYLFSQAKICNLIRSATVRIRRNGHASSSP